MFSMTTQFTKKLTILLGSFTLCGMLAQTPANAQEFPAPKKTVETIYHSPVPLTKEMKRSMKPGIRYTVGSVKQAGWHKGLVKGNKNLGHYFWAPMNHMVQASSSKRTKTQTRKVATQRKQFHYIKPIHAPLPKRPDEVIKPQRAKAKRAQYIHDNSVQRVVAKLRHKDMKKHLAGTYSFKRRNNNVNGRLISSKAPEAKVYAGDYGSSRSNARGYLTNKDAYGKILSD